MLNTYSTITLDLPRLERWIITVNAASTAKLVQREEVNLWYSLLVDGRHYDLICWKHTIGRPETTAALQQALSQVQQAIAALQPTEPQPTISDVFCCRECGADVAVIEQLGGDLTYECVDSRCGKAVSIDCPEALGIKQQAMAPEVIAEPAPAVPQDAAERKALYHRAQGVAPGRQADGWLVPSGSRAGVVYFVKDGRCSCEATKRCWHLALTELVSGALVAA